MRYQTIDPDATLEAMLRDEAVAAEAHASLAEIGARQYEILDELTPGRSDVLNQKEKSSTIAASRRRRADGLAARSGHTADFGDLRLDVVLQLLNAETRQVGLEEKLAHPELYAVTEEEATEQRRALAEAQALGQASSVPFPLTVEQIELNALQGRALIQSLREWLEQHPGEAPENDPRAQTDPVIAASIEALNRWNASTADPKKT